MNEDSIRTKKQLVAFLSTMITEMNAGVKVVDQSQKELIVEMNKLKYRIKVNKA